MEVNGQRKQGRPKMTWKRQVEESVKKVGLMVEEAADRTRWREGVRAIAEKMRCIPPPSVTRKKPNYNWMMMMMNIESVKVASFLLIIGMNHAMEITK